MILRTFFCCLNCTTKGYVGQQAKYTFYCSSIILVQKYIHYFNEEYTISGTNFFAFYKKKNKNIYTILCTFLLK